MNKLQQIWSSFKDKAYRKAYADDVGTGLAFQIKLLREKAGWSQGELGKQLGKTQPQVSQWENPDYGRYSLSTLNELAGAFDVALMVKFAPFSELAEWTANLTPEQLAPKSFEDDSLPVETVQYDAALQIDNAATPASISSGIYFEGLASHITDAYRVNLEWYLVGAYPAISTRSVDPWILDTAPTMALNTAIVLGSTDSSGVLAKINREDEPQTEVAGGKTLALAA